MSQLWLGRRFELNERGRYEAWGKARADRISVEIDPDVLTKHEADPQSYLMKVHAAIQRAARRSWEAGETTAVPHPFSGRLDHYRVMLSRGDLAELS